MSLVNEMLRDLDRRKRLLAGFDSSRVAADGELELHGGRKIYLVIVLAGCFLAFAAVGLYLVKNSSPQPGSVVVSSNNQNPAGDALVARSSNNVGEISPDSVVGNGAAQKVTARIAGERSRANGIELRVEVSKAVDFDVVSRETTGISVMLNGVDSISNGVTILDDVDVQVVDDGLLLNIQMSNETDFVVYENRDGGNFAVVVEGFWRTSPVQSQTNPLNINEQLSVGPEQSAEMVRQSESLDTAKPTGSASQQVAPVRTQRELSLEERDRTASQQALRQMRNGQMQQALSALYGFISDNPDAHQSRSTLITLLYAQKEYDQVTVLLDEGMELAPNLSSYKKIRARLLMASGMNQEALNLLKNVPPAVANDPEYFELLASSYQQTGNYSGAIGAYQDLLRVDSKVGRWWAGMGISHEAMGNYQDAIKSYEVALQMPSLESNLRQYCRNRIKNLAN